MKEFYTCKRYSRSYWISTEICNPGELYLVGSENDNSIFTFKEALEKLIKMSTIKNIDYVTEKEFVRPQVCLDLLQIQKSLEIKLVGNQKKLLRIFW